MRINRVVLKFKIMVQLFSRTCFGEALAIFALKMTLFLNFSLAKISEQNSVVRPWERPR